MEPEPEEQIEDPESRGKSQIIRGDLGSYNTDRKEAH